MLDTGPWESCPAYSGGFCLHAVPEDTSQFLHDPSLLPNVGEFFSLYHRIYFDTT